MAADPRGALGNAPSPPYLTVHKKVRARLPFQTNAAKPETQQHSRSHLQENQGLVRKLLPFNVRWVSRDPAVSPSLAAMSLGWVSSFLKPSFA